MASSIAPTPSGTPDFYFEPDYDYDYYPYRYGVGFDDRPECSVHRSVAEILWSFTATLLAALIAYGQLQYSLQGEKSVLKVAYKLIIFIIFPLYPACSLLVELFRTARAWRRDERRDPVYLLSRISGLRVSRQDDVTETLDRRHLWQYSWIRRSTKPLSRVGGCLLLLMTTAQCLGTLIRTTSRFSIDGSYYYRESNFQAFLAEDFESFYLSIGLLAVLIKSWLAFILNVEWRSDNERAPRSLDMSQRSQRRDREMSIFAERDSHLSPTEIISEIFMEFKTRALVLLIFYVLSWIVLGILSRRALIVFAAWTCVSVLAIGWLQRSEAEAVPGGKETFVSGFIACFLFLVPRASFYIRTNDYSGLEAYWVPDVLPWPLIVLATVMIARIILLHYYRLPYSSWQSKMSHLGLAALGTLLMIVLPAYIFSAIPVLDARNSNTCLPKVLPDPIWVPSL